MITGFSNFSLSNLNARRSSALFSCIREANVHALPVHGSATRIEIERDTLMLVCFPLCGSVTSIVYAR
jgi:hypothetical protein